MQTLLQDLRYATRQLWANWGFTLLVVLTISLGIGANTAIFSLVRGTLKPLPTPNPDQIVVLAAVTKGDETGIRYRFSFPALQDFRKQADRFSDLFGFMVDQGGIRIGEKPFPFMYCEVTGNFFSALGIHPVLGRLFEPGEGENPGADSTIVLGYTFWQKRYGGKPDIIGQQIRVNGFSARVLGVTPPEFHGPYAGLDLEGYMPLSAARGGDTFFTDRGVRSIRVLGRMKPGVSLREAQSSVDVLARRIEQQYPATDNGISVRVIPETEARPTPASMIAQHNPEFFLLLLAAVVLALACMNVANLLLVRGTVRQRELAIRAALGSGRSRLIRQALTESLLLAMLGAGGGLILGKWGSDGFASSIDLATDFPTLLDFSFDWHVFAYALTAAVATGLLIGIWPAWRASRTDAGSALHDGARGASGGPGRQRVRGALVVGQVAGSLMLLIVAGLFVRSLENAQNLNVGFAPDHLLNVRIDPEWAGYDQQRTKDFFRELERRVSALPGVQSVSLAFSVPLGYYGNSQSVYIEGRPEEPGAQAPVIGTNMVDAPYFDTMQIRIVRGRAFTDSDDEHAPRAAIVNQTMASRYWPNQDSLGKRFHTGSRDGPLWQVVGVAQDGKYLAVYEDPFPYFYVPLAQNYSSMRVLQVRSQALSDGAPKELSARVEREIHSLDPDMPITDLQTMRRALGGLGGFLLFRLGASQAAAMGVLGLILAVVGVYGVVSYGVAQRTREIGIRMAMGAKPFDILRLVLRQGLTLVAVGVLAGLALTLALARILRRVLLMASATDPLAFIGVTLLLAAVALAACYIPARRAMRVDPMNALRHE
jgi:macrolide transport system ATP-binding/permease protein